MLNISKAIKNGLSKAFEKAYPFKGVDFQVDKDKFEFDYTCNIA
jgi:hypothetical protein